MKKNDENTYQIKVSYINKDEAWNKLSNFLISFMVENNVIGEFDSCGEHKNDK